MTSEPTRWTFKRPRYMLRPCFLLFICITFVSCLAIMFISITGHTDDRNSNDLSLASTYTMAEMEMFMEHLTRLYKLKDNKDVQELINRFGPVLETIVKSSNVPVSKDLESLMVAHKPVEMLRSPETHGDVFTFLPPLWSREDYLRPLILCSGGRKAVSMVIGVPTVRRQKQNYFIQTLINIVSNMDQAEQKDSLIVVMIGEIDQEYKQQVTAEIKNRLPEAVNSGLVDVIAPSREYYPDFSELRMTLGDSKDRVHWRSKQNLDYALLMMYCQPRGSFYVQIEDDIITKPRFHTIMKNTALQRTAKGREWFILDFGELGFIGKMIRCSDLPWLIQFIVMFYNDQPGDWLLDRMVETKSCSIHEKNCKKRNDVWVKSNQTVFQHIGRWSSLNGKIQHLKARHF